jgi:drug/metabolite transporter (DMT)-like permease
VRAYPGPVPRREWTLLLTLAAIWGASYMFIKIGLRELSPGMITSLRIGLGALVLVPIAHFGGSLGGVRGALGVLALVALVQVAAPFLLINAGEQEISSALAGILVASAPIFTAILAVFVDQDERSRGTSLAGVIVGVVGVAMLLGVDLGGSGAELLGGLAVVLAALGYAVGGLIVKRRLSHLDPIGIAAAVMVIATAMTLPLAFAGAPEGVPGIGPLAAVAALGMLGTGVAFAIFYSLISRVGPARTFLVTYLAPAFAVVYGATLLGERVTVATIGGLALILAGSYLAAEGRLPWSPRRPLPVPVADAGSTGFAPAPAEDGGTDPQTAQEAARSTSSAEGR